MRVCVRPALQPSHVQQPDLYGKFPKLLDQERVFFGQGYQTPPPLFLSIPDCQRPPVPPVPLRQPPLRPLPPRGVPQSTRVTGNPRLDTQSPNKFYFCSIFDGWITYHSSKIIRGGFEGLGASSFFSARSFFLLQEATPRGAIYKGPALARTPHRQDCLLSNSACFMRHATWSRCFFPSPPLSSQVHA